MKKVCVLVVVLLLAGLTVFAKGEMAFFSEQGAMYQAFLASRGLTVLSEDQVYEAFGTYDVGSDPFTATFPKETLSVFVYAEYSNLPMILFKDCGIMYLAVEWAALQGNGTMSARAMSAIYADFCREFHFEIMMASQDSYRVHLCAENSETYGELEWFLNSQGDTCSTLYSSKDAFIDTVRNFVW